MENTVFTNEKWSTQQLVMRYGEHGFYSLYIEHKIFTHERWSPLQLLKNGVLSIYSEVMQSTAYTNDTWYPQDLFIRYGMASIYSQQIESTEVTHERW